MIDRRSLMLAGLTALTPLGARAQPAVDPTDPIIPQAALDFLPNQVTRMAVAVNVNGRRGLPFVVDTGANRTAVSQELAADLGLPAGPDVLVNGVTSLTLTPSVVIERLRVASSGFRDIVAPVFPRSRLGANGLLGLDVLGRFAITFNLDDSQLLLRRGGVRVAIATGTRLSTTSVLNARQSHGQLSLIDVNAEGHVIQAFIDSGSQYSIGNMALYDVVAATQREPGVRRPQVPVIGVTGEYAYGELAMLREIQLGQSTLRDLPTVFCDLNAFNIWGAPDQPALLFGADIFRRFDTVTIDFPDREVHFGPPRRGRRR